MKSLNNEQLRVIVSEKNNFLDHEWIQLISRAREIGLTAEEVRLFLNSKREGLTS